MSLVCTFTNYTAGQLTSIQPLRSAARSILMWREHVNDVMSDSRTDWSMLSHCWVSIATYIACCALKPNTVFRIAAKNNFILAAAMCKCWRQHLFIRSTFPKVCTAGNLDFLVHEGNGKFCSALSKINNYYCLLHKKFINRYKHTGITFSALAINSSLLQDASI